MVRLRSSLSGAVISCSAEKARRMGGEWQPVETKKSTPARRRRKSN